MSAQNQGEPTIALVLVLALLTALLWFIWHMTGDVILTYVLRYLRYGELWVVNLFAHRYDACLDWLLVAKASNAPPTPQAISATNACFGPAFLSQLPRDDVGSYFRLSFTSVSAIGAQAMGYYRWPLAFVLVLIGGYAIFLSPRNKFTTRHTLESLIDTQSKMWPVIMPIVKLNPSKTGRILGDPIPDKLPLFAEALSPEEWIAWNRIPVVNGIPDREMARRAFIRQLGPRWNGLFSLPFYMQALLATFALRGAQKREQSDALLGKLALAWSPENGFRPDAELVSEIKAVLKDPQVGGRIAPVMDRYAWRTTALLGALKWARDNGGVLAPAQFLWLRAEDRSLWYPLNNLGRRAFHSEGAGALAHFMAEEAAKKPLPIPRVDTCIVTLNTYLNDPDKRPIPIPPNEK